LASPEEAAGMSTLAGKVIAITGAGSGIGLACAKLLSARGAYLALADVNLPALEAAAKTISNTGSVEDGKIMLCGLDVRDRVAVRSFYETTKAHFGTLYGCANIAGVLGKNSNIQRIWEVDPAEYKVTMEVNTDGVWNCLAEQLKPSIMENGGSIVNMASTAGLVGLKLNAPYCASKFAVVGLTKASAQDAGDRSIRVNCVCP
jgi:NAD(P)-dependent dehydrogenase (short-subunit alcohol dehydrogenase family)